MKPSKLNVSWLGFIDFPNLQANMNKMLGKIVTSESGGQVSAQ